MADVVDLTVILAFVIPSASRLAQFCTLENVARKQRNWRLRKKEAKANDKRIKCSGEEPCANCQRRLMKCEYSEGTNITVNTDRRSSGRRRHGSEQQSTPGSKRSRGAAFGSGDEDCNSQSVECRSSQLHDSSECVYTSPFTLPSTTIKNTHKNKRNWIWLAPSSTWSFTARLTLMMAERLQVETPFSAPSFLNDEIYPLRWKASTVDGQPDISGLPSIDHAIYLFNTVKFHLGQNYQLIDETNFVKHLEEFYYGLASKKAAESPLWFVQFLLVLSFGQAFLSRSKDSKEPPGAKFFVRAMALLPEPNALWKDSLLAIEVLALAGLYLYSIYQRESAQLYIAQAIRIAQLEGLHTQLPEDALGTQTVARCRNLWWTLYIMDRHFSCSVGVPMNTQDADITTVLDPPSICSQRDATLGLQVKLSRLLSSIITTIYRSEKTPLGEFLTSTKSILHALAGHAQEIEKITRFKFQNSVDAMPKGTRSITLLYHQCVIMATRPLFLSALKQELENFGWGGRDPQTFSAPLKTLVETGIKSAVKSLQVLSGDDSLLVSGIPSGSIEAIIDPITTQTFVNEPDLVATTTVSESQPLASVFSDTPDNTEFLETIGISSDDFLSIVEQMGDEDDLPFSMLDLGHFWK
ncbi:Zn(II)2Cys6 transcription factor [Colletotrichum scovillei]|uniref:Zn(II)2Cys6 transcription factor n=1 Tax=Colletotrichum scovillei TaxID=1209932 RepID=A0A9P7R5H7_9PEZI|nr:Zn(II)2Cys6 transcription factor [Colletotrichum scovillei]